MKELDGKVLEATILWNRELITNLIFTLQQKGVIDHYETINIFGMSRDIVDVFLGDDLRDKYVSKCAEMLFNPNPDWIDAVCDQGSEQ